MAAPTTAPNAEFQSAGKPVAQPFYLVDVNGNPITSTNGASIPVSLSAGTNLIGGVNVAQFGGVNTTMATADGVAAANLPEMAIGLYNTSSGGTIDRMRDAGSVGDGSTIGLVAAAHYLFNGGSFDRQRTPGKFISIKNVAVTAGTAQPVWTPGSGKKFHLMGFAISLSVAGYIIFEDGNGGSSAEFIRTPGMAAGIGLVNPANFGNGYTSTAANNALYMDVSASGNINGFLFGTEEF
jgi:hypothetical protein